VNTLLVWLAFVHTSIPSPETVTIERLWRTYLAGKDGHIGACWEPSPLWDVAEQRQWRCYDIADSFIADDVRVGSIAIAKSNDTPGEYRVTTLFVSNDSVYAGGWQHHLTTTVYARRDGAGQWKFSGALSHNVKGWHVEHVGAITYIMPSSHRFDRSRADLAIRFADSVASAFAVPPLPPMTYYLTDSQDEAYRIVGLVSPVRVGPGGGFARPVNHQIFSGNPAVGEEYRHELVHTLIAPLVDNSTPYFVSEGVPTWLGGTAGLTLQQAEVKLERFLQAHPLVTLDAVVENAGLTNAEMYPGAAAVVAMVHARGGIAAVRALMHGGPGTAQVHATLERLLGKPWPAILTDWRDEVTRLANR
jgi:hypothetical protein